MSDESEEIARLRAQHQAAMYNLRTSFQYRLGDTLIRAVTSKSGAKAAPGKLVGLGREAVAHRRMQRQPLPEMDVTSSRSLQVASILDEFSHMALAPEVELAPISPGASLPAETGLMLAETAWLGNGGEWIHSMSQPDTDSRKKLLQLLEAAKQNGIPTALWNKEDPSNFDVFIDIASHFDWIFTSDAACVPRYHAALGHKRVLPLPFAAQPWIHNPIGSTLEDATKVAFAGAWRGAKYPHREQQLDMMFARAIERDALDVFDRFHDHPDQSKAFPARFAPVVKGQLTYTETMQAYRRYAGFLNINTADASTTMMSRRVFELLACRTPVISTPSPAIEQLGGGHVLTAANAGEARDATDRLLDDHDFRRRTAHLGYRHVHTHHRYSDRVDTMLGAIGIEAANRRSDDTAVTVVCVSNRPEFLDHAIANFARQSHPNGELLFVTNSSEFDQATTAAKVASVGGRCLHVDESAFLGDCLNEALPQVTTPYWAKFDDDDWYGAHHLSDLLLAFDYTDAAIVGRRSYFVRTAGTQKSYLRFPGREFQYVDFVTGGSFIASASRTQGQRFASVRQGTDSRFMQSVVDSGERIFSASRFNYVMERRPDPASHTWRATDREIAEASTELQTANIIDHATI